VQPILDDWAQRSPADFPNYASGSAGPASADTLLALGGRSWRPLNTSTEPTSRRAAKPKVDTAPAENAPVRRAAKKGAAVRKALRSTSVKKAVPAKKATAKKVASKKAAPKKAAAKKLVASKTATARRRGK